MKSIVLFASGSGSNVENIVNYFNELPEVAITCVLTNNRNAKVIDRCNRLGISSLCFNKPAFYGSDCVLDILKGFDPDLIVLAGFLWKIPKTIVQNFPNRIVNIHPALLPKYGGKGMYGMHVHRAVKEGNERETGITIHYVNENYDEGAIIHQSKIEVTTDDSPETIARKVHELEYQHFPKTLERLLGNKSNG